MTESSEAEKLSEKYTYADYLTWPDDERWELINGDPCDMTPAPKPRHQLVAMNLSGHIWFQLRGNPCDVYHAPFDVRFPPDPNTADDHAVDTVVQPDISVICDPNKIDDRGCVGPPDLIIEILSEETAGRDEETKFDLYEEHGVREYWIANPRDRTVRIYNLNDNGKYGFPRLWTKLETAESHAIQGLEVDLNEVFPDDQ